MRKLEQHSHPLNTKKPNIGVFYCNIRNYVIFFYIFKREICSCLAFITNFLFNAQEQRENRKRTNDYEFEIVFFSLLITMRRISLFRGMPFETQVRHLIIGEVFKDCKFMICNFWNEKKEPCLFLINIKGPIDKEWCDIVKSCYRKIDVINQKKSSIDIFYLFLIFWLVKVLFKCESAKHDISFYNTSFCTF